MSSATDARMKLAKAWASAGHPERAVSKFHQVLALEPEHVAAWVQLGHALLKLGQVDEALDAYAHALALAPGETEARIRYNFLQEVLSGAGMPRSSPPVRFENHPTGKLNLNAQRRITSHRSGGAFGVRALASLHHERGILFDSRIEDKFARQHWQAGVRAPAVLARLKQRGLFRQLATSEEQGIVPYTQPWVGVIHNPQNMPPWYHYHEAPQSIFAKEIWRKSLEYCQGLFTMSEYAAAWLRRETGQPVAVLTQPTAIPQRQFDFEKFLANPHKKIIQVGWWLRQLSAIYRLPLTRDNPLGYEKIRLVPNFFNDADAYLNGLMARELAIHHWELDARWSENTRELQHVDNDLYDQLLSENIAFAMMYDANANNLVVECIARATPLLINPLPAVVEYLGEEYPLYVVDVDQAAAQALDLNLLWQAHAYLKALDTRRKITAAHFLATFQASTIYQSLPAPEMGMDEC